MDHFSVTLLSDSSKNVYPNNTTANFQTQLAKPLHLGPGKWEVGTCEFAYPVEILPPELSWEIRQTFLYCNVIAIYEGRRRHRVFEPRIIYR